MRREGIKDNEGLLRLGEDLPQGERGSPLYWVEWTLRRRRSLVIVGLFLILLLTLRFDDVVSPLYSWATFGYIGYIVLLEILSRFTKRYHTNFWRAVRIQSHLVFSTVLLVLSGVNPIYYIVYLPWIVIAPVFFSRTRAFLISVEATILAVGAPLLFGAPLHSPDSPLVRGAIVAVGLMGFSVYSIYLWSGLVTQWRASARRMETLQKVGEAIVKTAGSEQMFERIFDLINSLVPFDTAVVLSFDASKEMLSPAAHRGYDPQFLKDRGFHFELGEGLTGYVASTEEPLLVNDVRESPPVEPKYHEIGEKKLLRSFIGIPLLFGDRLLGVFDLTSDQAGQFSEEHLAIIEQLSGQIALAMHTISLQNQLKSDLRKTETQLKELESLDRITLAMAERGLDIESLLHTIVLEAANLLNAHGGGLLLSYPEEETVRMAVSHRLDDVLGMCFDFGEGMAGRVAELGVPLIVNDYYEWPHRSDQLDKEPFRSLLKAIMQVPLIWQEQVIGVLAVSDNAPDRRFDKGDQELLDRFAGHAALAINNVRTHSYLRKLIESSPAAIIAVDKRGYVTEFNEASEGILGYERREVEGRHVSNYYWEKYTEAHKIHEMLLDTDDEGISDYFTHVRGKNGEKIPIRFSGVLLRDEAGREVGSLGIMTDVRREENLLAEQRRSEFLAELERYPQDRPILELADLRQRLTGQLEMTQEFCDCEYLILFANIKENETVLSAIAWVGLPSHVEADPPHFNWRKGGMQPRDGDEEEILRCESEHIANWHPVAEEIERMMNGVRGGRAEYFSDAACLVPLRLANNYRSVLVFGPCCDLTDRVVEADFIKSINLTIGTGALSWLQALHLRKRQEETERSAQLIIHRTRMNLAQINGKFGLIKHASKAHNTCFEIAEEGEDIVSDLSRSVSRALKSNVIEMEREDYDFQHYSMATLVQNCAERFREKAEHEGKDLRIDPTVETLPTLVVDPTLLSLALSNLIENALKYSFDNTYIRVRAEHDTRAIRIFVEDLGENLPDEAHINLEEPGHRWANTWRGSRIPGKGLGVWEASLIAKTHGGRVDFTSKPVPSRGREAYHVRIWIELPLKQD